MTFYEYDPNAEYDRQRPPRRALRGSMLSLIESWRKKKYESCWMNEVTIYALDKRIIAVKVENIGASLSRGRRGSCSLPVTARFRRGESSCLATAGAFLEAGLEFFFRFDRAGEEFEELGRAVKLEGLPGVNVFDATPEQSGGFAFDPKLHYKCPVHKSTLNL
jgi:hypothetical protein